MPEPLTAPTRHTKRPTSAFQIADASSSLEGRVLWNSVCPGYSSLGHSKVVLDDSRYSGGIRRDGSFSIPDVDEGSYILNVLSHDIMFDSFRVDVHSPGESLPDVRPYVQGTPHNPPSTITLQYPIALTPRQKANYFVEPQSFNALGMLQNPMVLMMLVMGVLVIGLPYLIKNLDPEVAKELNERQSRVSGIQSSIQSGDFRSGFVQIHTLYR
ncbi:uncharacterized protein FOMMEDRAFT_81026 [Fomitiporia mediterranea MF3/22]|uniref:uncharacterized protein n=1 Tax=Fomitiporia mediterranea (strain MF3/22) TaxID=694068 RepID=UPI0004407362|nr:uncharacterized protein FOMMEDRAFT_81026 [Fomitiporia mediterranea MF3/22]EJD04925.1 hypothetical protein FOMMEDRAFT_81026 [Fomitiporia mediterranea MF3/22]